MPRRLRVAFVPSEQITLLCSAGSFTRTGVSAQLTYVPNAVIADTWTKLSGAYGNGDVRGGPNINQGWTKAAISSITGKVFLAQGYPALGVNAGTFFFNPSLGYWERTNTVSNDWHRNMGIISENYDITFDADRDCFWRSDGGPFGGNSLIPAGSNGAGPWLGDGKYNVATDEWSTPYPDNGSTWVPLAGDTGYFGTPGNCLTGFDSAYLYYNDAIYQFGGFSVGNAQNLKKRDLTTGTITTLALYTAGPPMTQDSRTPHLRSGFDSRTKQLWTCANQMAYWVYDLTKASPAWEAITTTGTAPTVQPPNSSLSSTSTDFGMLATIDEAANCLVAWCGQNVVASDTGIQKRTTWIMDLATRVWRLGPYADAGHTVPPGEVAVKQSLMYDPVGRRTILAVGNNFATQVWALQIAPIGGKITSWALPASVGGVYGVTYYGFPFVSNGSSKHINMAYCPLDGRLYASGGDTQAGSATDGIWSMSLEDGSWRLDVGKPVYSTTPAPHAMQDGALFDWMPSRNKFIFGFGGYFPYDSAGADLLNYAKGWWTYDPLTATWEQQFSFFNVEPPPNGGTGGGTGNEYGGVYDPDTDTVYVLGEGVTVALGCKRYNIGTGVQDSTISFTVPSSGVSGYTQAVFGRGRQCQIGRYIYAIGYYSNGITKIPALWRYGIDDHTFVKLAQPPAFTTTVDDKELVLVRSNGKLLHPRRNGPEGNMPEGMHIYNPANDSWSTDTKTPAYGNYIANSVCHLPDGRVAMSGGVFGSQQTHMWFYEAT